MSIEEIMAQRLEVCEKELQELEEMRKLLVWRIAEYRELLGLSKNGAAITAKVVSPKPHGDYSNFTSLQTIEAILRASPGKMKIVDIAKAAIAGGYGGPDADIEKVVPNFSSMVSRSLNAGEESPFVRAERGYIDLRLRHVHGPARIEMNPG